MPEAVYAGTLTPGDFITRDAFNIQVKSIRDRAEAGEKVSDARFDRLEALMAQNLAEQKSMFSDIRRDFSGARNEMKLMNNRMTAMENRIDKLDARVETLQEDVGNLKGDVKAISARLDAVQWKTGLYVALLGIVLTFVIAAVQFWK